jgi:phage gpG-like protein
MTGTALTFKSNIGGLENHLKRLSARREFKAAKRAIGEYMVGDIQDNFDNQKLFDGSAMPRSKPADGRTTHWKRSNKSKSIVKGDVRNTGKTLIDDHHLYDSYVYQLAREGVEVGSNKAYAAIHHFGGETGGRGHRFRMLARPVMGIATRQELQIGYLLIQAIKDIEAAK